MDMMRIYANIDINENGCWIWQRSVNSAGYGQLTEGGKYWLAHRYAYTALLGEIPEGLLIRHGSMCSTRCCNPQHLELGTDLDNYYDSIEKHNASNLLKRKGITINGIFHNTFREASLATGLSLNSLVKYNNNNGLFDIEGYREGCKIANVIPKV